MPRIPVFTPDPKLPQPIATARQFGSAVGEALQDVGGEIQTLNRTIDEFRTQNQISELNVKSTELQAQLAVQWRETMQTADPHDDTIAETFMQEVVGPALEGLSGIAKTGRAKSHLKAQSAGLTASFFKATFAGQIELAGAAAVADLDVAVNNISSAAFVDPANIGELLNQVEFVIASQEGLSGVDRIKLTNNAKELVAEAAIRGAMELNPGGTEQLLSQGIFADHISGTKRAQLLNAAQAAAQASTAQVTKFASDQAALARGEAIDGLINDDGTIAENPTPEQITALERDPRFQTPEGQADKEAIFKLYRSMLDNDAPIKSNPAIINDFNRRLAIPIGEPGRLTIEEIDFVATQGALTLSDRKNYLAAIEIGGTPQGSAELDALNNIIAGLKTTITNTNLFSNIIDGPGDQRFSTFENLALGSYTSARAAGVPHEALVDPANPNYIGNLARQFMLTTEATKEEVLPALTEGVKVINDPVQGIVTKPNVTPRKPGASFDEMTKRRKELEAGPELRGSQK